MKSKYLLASLLVCILLTAHLAHAQGVGSSGAITGSVIDPAGAVVPKATVVAEDSARGLRHAAVTDSDGRYELLNIPPGSYNVTVKVSGFQTEVMKGVVVSVGAGILTDFHLKLATTATELEVSAESPVVEVERSHQADTVSEQYITDLPIDRRDYLTFTQLMPGVSDSTRLASDQDFRVKQTPQSGLSFYGSNGRGNSVTVDGGEANDDSGGVRLTLSQDAVEEFQINRSNYAAELGGASGASINIVSKTGTNQMHGSLYGFFRNDALDAGNPFAFSQALQPGQAFNPLAPDSQGTQVKNSLDRQQFGGTVGFPIHKDKTFFFAAFEGLRQDAQNAVPLITSTSIFRPEADTQNNQAGVIRGLPGVNQSSVPCLSGPIGAAVAARLGLPQPNPTTNLPPATCAAILNGTLTVNPANPVSAFLVNQLESNGGVLPYTSREYQGSARLDHHFSENNQVFLRYSYAHDLEESPDVQSLTGFSRGSLVRAYDHTIQGSWFHQFSQLTQNELKVQWNYSNFDVIPNVPGQIGLDIPGFANLGTQIFLPSLTIMRRPQFADNFTMVRGRHTMKFGGEELLRGNHSESHTFFPGRFVFGSLPGNLLSPCLATPAACSLPASVSAAEINSLQSVSFGLPQFYEQGFGTPVYDYPRNFAAFYWQDSWKITPSFTLNYGLRYELDSQYGTLNTDKDNFAPRVSFAWDPFKDHKTVLRGGFGIFYSPIYGQIADVVHTLGNINGTRQIANVLVPLTGDPLNPNVTSASIFGGLFAKGLVQCTTPAPGNAACVTAADVAPLGVNVSNTGPLPDLTVIFTGQPDYQNPYSEQASIGIEREIAPGFSVSLSGIYSHTLRLPVAIDTNAVPQPFQFVSVKLANGSTVSYRDWNSNPALDPVGVAPCAGLKVFSCFVNPLILQADQYSSQASALYEGGILEVKKRFSSNFTLLGNYTYSKAFDTSTDFNSDFGPVDNTNLAQERGLSDFDQRHKFVLAAVLDSPWKNPFLAGFELAPILRYNSGHPYNLLAGVDINGDRHSTNDRPIGAGRNTGLGPDYTDFDMRLSRQFKLGEHGTVQLMAEGFNIANHTNFASVNNEVGIAFGLNPGFTTFHVHGTNAVSPSQPLGFTSVFPKREIQLGVRFSF
jgi:hypothetical protein